MQMALKRCPTLFSIWPGAAYGTEKLMGKLPDMVLQAGWDRCLHQDHIRRWHLLSSLHLACIWDVDSQDAIGRSGGFEGRP